MNARRCDRCRKYYNLPYLQPDKISCTVEMRDNDDIGVYYAGNDGAKTYDLCHECRNDFKELMWKFMHEMD